MNITVFNTITGQIAKTGSVTDQDAAQAQCGQDEAWLEGTFADDKFYIENLQPVLIPTQPSVYHIFDYTIKQWIDPRSVETLKVQKWEEIKKQRDNTEFGGFTWDGSTFDSDQISQSRIQGASQLAQLALAQSQPFSIDWTLADNSVRALSGTEMLAVGVAMGQHISSVHSLARAKRVLIDSATTKEEVEAIVW